jgi:hypothetical protein
MDADDRDKQNRLRMDICTIRRRLCLSSSGFARLAGVTPKRVKEWESGTVPVPAYVVGYIFGSVEAAPDGGWRLANSVSFVREMIIGQSSQERRLQRLLTHGPTKKELRKEAKAFYIHWAGEKAPRPPALIDEITRFFRYELWVRRDSSFAICHIKPFKQVMQLRVRAVARCFLASDSTDHCGFLPMGDFLHALSPAVGEMEYKMGLPKLVR